MSAPRASVVIRAKDEGRNIGRTLELLAAQTAADAAEVIVVDSGSSDDTVVIARRHGARIVEIPAASFTFGGALNTGTAQARADVVVALSAHSFATDPHWLEHVLDTMGDERVACASGQNVDHTGTRLTGPALQDIEIARANPQWGYSSHAGAFRTALWREYPFRSDMPATEDKEWAWHWLERGYLAALDPRLVVEHSHGRDPLREQYRRGYVEAIGMGILAGAQAPSLGEAARVWWTDRETYASHARARLSHRRLARLAGAYAGRRAAVRRGPDSA
jgi:rhamnosyltransferase